MANAILNFHFDFLNTSLITMSVCQRWLITKQIVETFTYKTIAKNSDEGKGKINRGVTKNVFCWCRYVAVFESVHASCEERLEMASFSVLIRISWLQTCPWTGPASWLVESGELWTNQSAPGILAWQWRAASLENSRERQTPPDTQVERGPSEFVRSQEFAS